MQVVRLAYETDFDGWRRQWAARYATKDST